MTRPDDDVLTLEKLAADMDRLGLWNRPPLPRVIVSDFLPDEQQRRLTRRERFWVWIEDLCDRAEIYYYGPKIKRTEPAPSYLIGHDLYVTRRTAAAIRIVT
jgi:hypothetical protein